MQQGEKKASENLVFWFQAFQVIRWNTYYLHIASGKELAKYYGIHQRASRAYEIINEN